MMILAMWFDDGSISSRDTRLLMIFVGMVAFAMVVQAIVVGFAAYGAAKARKRVLEIVEEARERALPLIATTHSVVHDLQPKVRTIADNFVETSHVVRAKAQEFDATLSDVNERARVQTERVDDMVSTVLDTTAGIGSTLQKGFKVPIGLVSGIKAGIDSLIGRSHGNGATRYPDDPSI